MDQNQLRESATLEADDVLEYIPKDERDQIPLKHFAWPEQRKYPCDTQAHLDACAKLIGRAPENIQAKIKANAIRIAKELGLSLPDSWKADAKESAFAPTALGKSTYATLVTTWLEDGAISLNGRQYRKEAVDKLIQSAQVHLSTPGAAPLTCYISHEAADRDDSLKLAGRITSVWREGSKAKAKIALVNTEAGRTMATQADGGYLQTMSLRASNAEIQRPKDSTWPVVGGSSLRLDGIDFTATPGIDVAKIEDVALAENAREGPQRLHEVFNAQAPLVEVEQKENGMDKLNEADMGGNRVGGYSPTSGDSPSMDGAPSQGAYGRLYQKPEDTTGSPMQGMAPVGRPLELQEAHDRVSMVQGRSCAPSRESKEWRHAMRSMTEAEQQETVRIWQLLDAGRIREAGKSLSGRNDGHLDVAHDSLARHMKMDCEGAGSKPRFMPADDGMQGDDDQESAKPQGNLKEQQHKEQEMTPEEMAQALAAAGYKIEKPKTQEDLLREQLESAKADQTRQIEEAKAEQARQLEEAKAEQARQLAEMRAQFAASQPDPQRRSQVLAAQVDPKSGSANPYKPGQYLRERLNNMNWQELTDRTRPLPPDLDIAHLIKEFEQLYAVQYDNRFQVLSATLR